jgi:hypothetical protein
VDVLLLVKDVLVLVVVLAKVDAHNVLLDVKDTVRDVLLDVLDVKDALAAAAEVVLLHALALVEALVLQLFIAALLIHAAAV